MFKNYRADLSKAFKGDMDARRRVNKKAFYVIIGSLTFMLFVGNLETSEQKATRISAEATMRAKEAAQDAAEETKRLEAKRKDDIAVGMIQLCSAAVQSRMQRPQSFDRHLLSTSDYETEDGGHFVEFDFDAKNGFGNEVPGHATCHVHKNGKIDIAVTQ